MVMWGAFLLPLLCLCSMSNGSLYNVSLPFELQHFTSLRRSLQYGTLQNNNVYSDILVKVWWFGLKYYHMPRIWITHTSPVQK